MWKDSRQNILILGQHSPVPKAYKGGLQEISHTLESDIGKHMLMTALNVTFVTENPSQPYIIFCCISKEKKERKFSNDQPKIALMVSSPLCFVRATAVEVTYVTVLAISINQYLSIWTKMGLIMAFKIEICLSLDTFFILFLSSTDSNGYLCTQFSLHFSAPIFCPYLFTILWLLVTIIARVTDCAAGIEAIPIFL